MLHPSVIESKLGGIGFKTSRWFRPEIKELEHILMEDEEIIVLACGRYFGSFALLVATDQRLLLIDKRVFFMTVEDTRYDMVSEIDYNSQMYSATVTIFTMNKTHKFTSVKYKKELRELTNYVQRRVMEIRRGGNQVLDLLPSTSTAYIPAPRSASAAVPAAVVQQTSPAVQQTPTAPAHVAHNHFGHVAHLIGTAATRSAHAHHMPHPHFPHHFYTQGSLVTRQPIASNNY